MNRISDERLDELIVSVTWDESGFWNDLESALRELLAYRKAVREWIAAMDALKKLMGEQHLLSDRCELEVVAIRAEAALRALAQPEQRRER